jgi:hypothetical protein
MKMRGSGGGRGGICIIKVTSLFWVFAFLYLLVPCFRSSFLASFVFIMFTSLLLSFLRLYNDISPYFYPDVFFARDVIIVILIYIGLLSEIESQTVNIYVSVFRNLHTSECKDVSVWCETAVAHSLCLTPFAVSNVLKRTGFKCRLRSLTYLNILVALFVNILRCVDKRVALCCLTDEIT